MNELPLHGDCIDVPQYLANYCLKIQKALKVQDKHGDIVMKPLICNPKVVGRVTHSGFEN